MTDRSLILTKRSQKPVYKIPAIVGVLTCVGLLAALVGDDGYDITSWIALSVPLALLGWHLFKR